MKKLLTWTPTTMRRKCVISFIERNHYVFLLKFETNFDPCRTERTSVQPATK